ncbi:MAG: hypothetical protein DRH24_14165, partial [Deltaproteobacteria bacterium]
ISGKTDSMNMGIKKFEKQIVAEKGLLIRDETISQHIYKPAIRENSKNSPTIFGTTISYFLC